MPLLVVVPHLEPNLRTAELVEWHVGEGDHCPYGRPLCDLAVTERTKLSSTRRASVLSRLGARTHKGVEGLEVERDRFVVTYRVVASEPVEIVELLAAPGDRVEVGATLALATTHRRADLRPDVDTDGLMRVVAVLADGLEP
jgi:hypothetical protein